MFNGFVLRQVKVGGDHVEGQFADSAALLLGLDKQAELGQLNRPVIQIDAVQVVFDNQLGDLFFIVISAVIVDLIDIEIIEEIEGIEQEVARSACRVNGFDLMHRFRLPLLCLRGIGNLVAALDLGIRIHFQIEFAQ